MKRFFGVMLSTAIAMSLIILVAACDLSGSSKSSRRSADTRANDAIAAIPLAGEVVGLSGTGGSVISTISASQLVPLDAGSSDEHFEGISDWINEFLSGDHLVSILKLVAEEVPLSMNVENRPGVLSTDFLPQEPDSDEPFAAEVDFGVILVSERTGSVNITWAFDMAAFYGDTGIPAYIDATMKGYPDVSEVEFWFISEEDNGVRWEYQRLNPGSRSVDKLVTQPPEEAGHRNKEERMVFRGTADGTLDAIVSTDEEEYDLNNILSFRVASDHTALAYTDKSSEVTTHLLKLFGSNDSLVQHFTTAGEDGPDHTATVHGMGNVDLYRESGPETIDSRLTQLLDRSADLFPEWQDIQEMPVKPRLEDYPGLQ